MSIDGRGVILKRKPLGGLALVPAGFVKEENVIVIISTEIRNG
jgi:hypothetical protein